jgi:hypothetical protein
MGGMQAEDVAAGIRDAFADVWCPLPLTSGPIGSLIDDLSHFEYDMKVSPDFSLRCAFGYFELLWVFTPGAHRFYLPKFLIAATDTACEPSITEALVFNLFPPPAHSLQERARFEARVSLLDAAQVDAVREFLRFIAERDAEEHAFVDDEAQNPQRALDRYWSRA